jgi:hypothetical protein
MYAGGNRLIDALGADERSDLLNVAEVIQLASGDVTQDPGGSYDYVIFPIDAILSVVTTLRNGTTCEIGMVGNEGASAAEIAFGAPILRKTICQVPGRALRLTTTAFLRMIDRNPGLDALVRATEKARSFFNEQMIVCNTLHTIEQRCARWLLLMADTARRDDYLITHEFLSYMLGVRRASITDAAKSLSYAGAVEYRRGRMRIMDRPKLESMSCECYEEVTRIFTAALHSWGDTLARRTTGLSVRPPR